MSLWLPTIAASSLGLSYVGSLYVWRSPHDRDHPDTIKRRFISAFVITLISPPFVYYFGADHLMNNYKLADVIGFRLSGLWAAVSLPLGLTMILFLGPITMMIMDERFRVYLVPSYWSASLRDWIWWRNHVVAPFTEEYTFRACMLPILLGYYTNQGAIMISPLFFGIAHFHHMIERIRKGQDLRTAFLISAFQFTYTTIFGMYSAFLFLRTGHIAAPVIVHGFCNFMGFPDLVELYNQEPKRRLFLSAMFVTGLGAFYFSLYRLTDPTLYENLIYTW